MKNIDLYLVNRKNGVTSYLLDYDIAIRILPDEKRTTFLKYKGLKEHEVLHSNETAFETLVGGEFITKEQYDSL